MGSSHKWPLMDRSLKLPCLGQRHLSLDQVVQISIQPGIEYFLCEMGCPKPAMSSLKHTASKLTGEGSCTFRQYKHAQNKHHTICSGSQNKVNQNCKLKKRRLCSPFLKIAGTRKQKHNSILCCCSCFVVFL